MNTKTIAVCFLMMGSAAQAQQLSTLDKSLMIGSLLIQGYQAIRGAGAKPADPNAKTVESFCFKNKMDEKISIKLLGKIDGEDVKKELVIQKDTKECSFELPKGVYTYEIALSSKDIYKKGEYNVTEETLITVNHD